MSRTKQNKNKNQNKAQEAKYHQEQTRKQEEHLTKLLLQQEKKEAKQASLTEKLEKQREIRFAANPDSGRPFNFSQYRNEVSGDEPNHRQVFNRYG